MKTIKSILLGVAALLTFGGCSNFLDIKPTDQITADALFASEGGVQAFLANLYYQMPIESWAFAPAQSGSNYAFHFQSGDANNNGRYAWNLTDDCIGSQVQECVQPNDYNGWWGDAYILNNNLLLFSSYIDGLTSIDEDAKHTLWGEYWFIRGQLYFALARRYGGVPIIEEIGSVDDLEALKVDRETEVKTWDYVIDCFQKAADNLGEGNPNRTRPSKWTALGYLSRAALHAASLAKYWDDAPLSGDAVNKGFVGGFTAADATRYYKACRDAAEEVINSGFYSLYNAVPKDAEDASKAIQHMFEIPADATVEAMFIKGFNEVGNYKGTNQDNWLNPAQTAGAWPHPGRSCPTIEFAENFEYIGKPGESGKFVTYNGDNFNYNGFNKSNDYIHFDNPTDMFKDKDARLSALCILPNTEWKGKTIVIQGGYIKPNGDPEIGVGGISTNIEISKDGAKTKFYKFGGPEQAYFSGFSDNGGNNTRTGFIFKRGLSQTYVAPGAKWNQSTTDWIDLRYAEVLLNYAEAYAETGEGDAALAKQCLNETRHRAALTGDLEPTVENVRRERRAELALENARTWDLIRWRQFDKIFDNYKRGALVPVLDLRDAYVKVNKDKDGNPESVSAPYIFLRMRCQNTNNQTFQRKSYYKSIPGIGSNGISAQNPQY